MPLSAFVRQLVDLRLTKYCDKYDAAYVFSMKIFSSFRLTSYRLP